MDIAFRIAKSKLPNKDKLVNASIAHFAQGAFHRLYLISDPDETLEYIMRVALPVNPFYKTESEVATMDYVGRHSSIPMPRVIAYDSSASNDLGFEWILMTRIEGCPIGEVWDEMPFEAKEAFTVDLADHLNPPWELKFPLFGSIYYADVWNQVGFTSVQPYDDDKIRDIGIKADFVIGRMVSTRLFRDKRVLLGPQRGPFSTAQQLALAEVELVSRRVRHLSPSPEDTYYCEVDKGLAVDGKVVLDTIDEMVDIVPTVYESSDCPEDAKVLWHDDLSSMNILVDPKTFKLTGIVDWESTSIIPEWETEGRIPYHLKGISVLEPPPLGSLSAEEEEGLVYIRKDWDLVLLRRKYAEMTPSIEMTPEISERLDLKRGFCKSLGRFEGCWDSASMVAGGKFQRRRRIVTTLSTPSGCE